MSTTPDSQKVTARQRLHDDLLSAGWRLLHASTDRESRFYRWSRHGIRRELCLLFDEAGRLDVWSEWHSTRQAIDDETGRRARLLEMVALDA